MLSRQRKRIQKLIILTIVALAHVPAMYAQELATVTGKVLDAYTGEPIPGVTVLNRAAQATGITDVSGSYFLTGVPTGQARLEFYLSGYNTAILNVTVKPGVNTGANLEMEPILGETIVVTARRLDNTTAALLNKRKKAATAQDAISAEQISKSPDSNAADAVRRMPGVTIVDGKYVYIRGLSERYTTVQFAGSNIPSPEPDKRVVPLDTFPAGLLDNLIAQKTWSPADPSEFGAGLLQINPKDYPDEAKLKVGVAAGGNTRTTFKDFYTYNGGDLDWAGIEDGTRDRPAIIDNVLGDNELFLANNQQSGGFTAQQIAKFGRSFNKRWNTHRKKGTPNGGIDFEYGNAWYIGKEAKIGVIASGLFKQSSQNIRYTKNFIQKQGTVKNATIENESEYSTTKGGLFGFAIDPTANHQFKYITFYNQNTTDKTIRQQGFLEDLDANIRGRRLQFISTELWFNQLSGKNRFGDALTFDWRGALSKAYRDEPDTRDVTYFDSLASENERYIILANQQSPSRYWSENEDTVKDVSGEFTLPWRTPWAKGLTSNFKIGGLYFDRKRTSDTRRFIFDAAAWAAANNDLADGSVASILADSNFDTDPSDNFPGVVLQDTTRPSDSYVGTHKVGGGFGQVDLRLLRWWRIIGGARFEASQMKVRTASKLIDTEPIVGSIEENDILPGVNSVFAIRKNTNIRLGFSQTLVRPDFKEMSPFESPAIVGGYTIKGNENIKQSKLSNYDLRLEWFPTPGEIIAGSLFYKDIQKPIEKVELAGATPQETVLNANSAQNFGAELEYGQSLGFLAKAIKDFSFGFNFSYISSSVDLPSQAKTDIPVQYTNTERALQGQSPWIVNSRFGYDNQKWLTSFTVLFTMFGERISRVGVSGIQDTFEKPAPILDFVYQQGFTNSAKFKVTISNILDPKIQQKRKGNQLIESYRKGIDLGFSFGYTWGGSSSEVRDDTKAQDAAAENEGADGEAGPAKGKGKGP